MMVDDRPDGHTSRRSTHKSTSPDSAVSDPEPPTVDDRVREFYEDYPDKANKIILDDAGDDPRRAPRVRKEAAEHYPVEHNGDELEGDYFPLTWGGVLREYLDWFQAVRDLRGRFSDGEDSWQKRFLTSYHPRYLNKYYAQLMGLHREIEREWSDPHTALLTLTSSGTDDAGGPRGPVDHHLERRDAWPTVYKRLYDRMEQLLDEGRIEDWCYVVIEEHHPGPFKKNTGYGHDHPVVIADGELDPSDFFDVIDTWVETCPGAGHDAHDYRHPRPEKRPIKVRRLDAEDKANPDVINSAAGYLVKYLGDPDREVLERDVEQLAQHAIKWATNTRRLRKSDRAGEAIAADLCRQSFRDDDRLQDVDHAERLEHRREGRGPEIVCSQCGSSWGIDPGASTVVEAVGGAETSHDAVEPTRRERLASAWKDAAGAARVDEDGLTAVSLGPTAQLEAFIIQGEEHPARGSGGGVEMVPLRSRTPTEIAVMRLEGDKAGR